MSCPKTEGDFITYFYELIGKTLGSPADDWEYVMARRYPWANDYITIPPGVGPGVILPSNAPFYGLTQQWSGGPKGRVFLPAAIPDSLGYFTRNIQYIKRVNPDGVYPTHIWVWEHKDGNDYVPICDGGTVPPPTPDPIEARVKALEVRYALLEERVTALENKKFPSKIALQNAANGKFVAAEVDTSKILFANRDSIGPWEKFNLISLE